MPDDTLYIIFESDMEFFEDSKIPETFQMQQSHDAKRKRDSSSPSEKPHYVFARDIVRLATAAHRADGMNFLWCGYQPKKPEKQTWGAPHVQFGSQMICLNKTAARQIFLLFSGGGLWKPGHIDMELLKYCRDHRFSKGKAAYLWPPIGSFRQHESGCCPSEGQRASWWKYSWTAQGTRPSHEPQARPKQIYRFVESGHVDLLTSVNEDFFAGEGEPHCWKTFVMADDSTMWQEGDTQNYQRLRRTAKMQLMKMRNHVAEHEVVV